LGYGTPCLAVGQMLRSFASSDAPEPSALSRKYIEDVHYLQGLKPHSFYQLYVRAEALTHKEEM